MLFTRFLCLPWPYHRDWSSSSGAACDSPTMVQQWELRICGYPVLYCICVPTFDTCPMGKLHWHPPEASIRWFLVIERKNIASVQVGLIKPTGWVGACIAGRSYSLHPPPTFVALLPAWHALCFDIFDHLNPSTAAVAGVTVCIAFLSRHVFGSAEDGATAAQHPASAKRSAGCAGSSCPA